MHGSSTAIRPADDRDRDELLVLARAFSTSFAVVDDAFDRSLSATLADHNTTLLVATLGSEVAGYALASIHHTLYANGSVAWIEELMVSETARRHGLGALLVTAVEQWATDRAVRLVAMATRRAQPFWEAIGYEPSATYLRKLLTT